MSIVILQSFKSWKWGSIRARGQINCIKWCSFETKLNQKNILEVF